MAFAYDAQVRKWPSTGQLYRSIQPLFVKQMSTSTQQKHKIVDSLLWSVLLETPVYPPSFELMKISLLQRLPQVAFTCLALNGKDY